MTEEEYNNMGLKNNLKSIPVLCDRIYDYICVEDKQRKYLKDIKFTIISAGDYQKGEKICIEEVFVKYKAIGLIDEEIETKIDNLGSDVYLYASKQNENCQCKLENNGEISNKKIYNIYTGTKMLDIDYKGYGYKYSDKRKSKKVLIGEDELKFYICKAKLIVKGKIGTELFKAESSEFSGRLSEGFGFKEVDLFGEICLPCGKNRVDFQEIFDGCFSIDYINVTQLYNEDCEDDKKEFYADAFSTLLIIKKIYATMKEEVIIYTSPNKVICNDGTIDSICKKDC